MTEPFTLPSLFWLLPLPFLMMGFAIFFVRRGAVFAFLTGLVFSWFIFDSMYGSFVESWLAKQRIYAILFRDFPSDKQYFVAEHLYAYRNRREMGLRQKQEEMKIVMAVNRLKYYIANTPAQIISQHIIAQTWLLRALYQKDHYSCDRYVANSQENFAHAWRMAGNETFLASVSYTPLMIVDAVDNPEPVSASDRLRAVALYSNMLKSLKAMGVTISSVPTCEAIYGEFYLLSQMPPKDAALIVKLIYSEDHLKAINSADSPIMEQLVPFH